MGPGPAHPSRHVKRNTFENSLQDAYSNLQAVLESTGDGILVVDDGKVVNYNKSWFEIDTLEDFKFAKFKMS